MSINLSNLSPHIGSKKTKKRRGRGNSSGRGKFSGRGQKGQRSRSGGKKGLAIKGAKGTLHRLSKIGGFRSLKRKPSIVNLKDIENKFVENDVIDIDKLLKAKLVRSKKNKVKILAKGKIKKSFTIKANAFSSKAEQLIKKAGGKAIIIE